MKTPRFWRDTNLLSLALTPLSWLYGLGAWADRAFTTPRRAALPVISIGNATAGGAGKTPTALALAPLIEELGATPHFISRGYGGAVHEARRVTADDDWQQVGDEALLLARTAPTWVGPSRLASIAAAAQAGATLAICDDAHQHHALAKTLSLLVIDGPYGIGNGRLLPAGPLREPFAAAIARSDAAILIGEDTDRLAPSLGIPVFHATLEPSGDTAALHGTPWLAFAGTGRPEKFFESLARLGLNLAATRAFADHHPYSAADIAGLKQQAAALGAGLITTEKDIVKLSPQQASGIAVLPVTLTFREPQAIRAFLRSKLS